MRALLLQAFYTVRSERQLMEQLNYNLLFRWFVGLSTMTVWDATCSARTGSAARRRYCVQVHDAVLNLPEVRQLLSSEHFWSTAH